MGELASKGLNDFPSQYARMIPGASVIPRRRFATAEATPISSVNAANESNSRHTHARTPTQQPSPKTTVDRFTLFQLMAADLVVLLTVCGALSLFSPAWGLPPRYLPIFVVLVMLFGFCEGIYKRAGDPS